MTGRILFCLLLLTGHLAAVIVVEAQQPTKLFKIGFLGARPAASATGLDRLRQELGSLGYVEGKNIAVESRYADNKLIADLAVKYRLPAIYPGSNPVASSGLISYGPDRAEPYKRVASRVERF